LLVLSCLPARFLSSSTSRHSACQTTLSDVSSAEQVKKFLIVPQPFSVAADELTVSLKLRRNMVLARYARQTEEFYREEKHQSLS
jgi:long-subunit acyl-CoA synthetase (AMP-forming)